MYNSDDNTEENLQKFTESNQGSLTSNPREPRNNAYKPKNEISNVMVKHMGVSGNYTRIIPRKPVHDYEKLYSENIQLKETIRSLEDTLVKLKTRMNYSEKQKHQLQIQARSDNFEILQKRKASHPNMVSHHSGVKNRLMKDENRKILYEYKDKIKKLEDENLRMKKTVKYCQMEELQIENDNLHDEMARMKEVMNEIVNNTEYEEYQRQIQHLNKLLQTQKDSKKSMHNALKKKDEEVEEVKEKLKNMVNRKIQLEKRYNREVNNFKGEMFRAKEREKELCLLNTVEEKRQNSKAKNMMVAKPCSKCPEHQKNIENLSNVVKNNGKTIIEKDDYIAHLQSRIRQLETKLENSHAARQVDVKEDKHEQTVPLKNSAPNRGQENKEQVIVQKQSPKKTEKLKTERKEEEKYQQQNNEDEYLYNEDDDHDDDLDTNKLLADSNDEVDMLHVNLKKKTEKSEVQIKEAELKEENELNEYEDEFKGQESDGEEEVLFQKEERNIGSKRGSRPKNNSREAQKDKEEKKKEKKKEKEKEKEKKDGEKGKVSREEKILSETIKYRLIGQRYTFEDFHRDIRESGAKEFAIQDFIQMLTNEPFLLHEKHLEMILVKCFGKNQFSESDIVSTDRFMEVIKPMFNGVVLLEEEEEKLLTKGIQKKIKKKAQQIFAALEDEGADDKISMKGFMRILSEVGKLKKDEIEQCLAETSVVSLDISQINYPQFMSNMLQDQN